MAAAQAIEATVAWPVVAVALLGWLLAIVFVYRVLTSGGSPASTLVWVMVILAAPWLGLLLYYLLPRRLQIRRLKRVRGARQRMGRPTGRQRRTWQDAVHTGLSALLAGPDGTGLVAGNTVRWLPSGEQFFGAAEAAIDRAQRHVHCVVYIFRGDTMGRRFLAILTRAAARGVKVRLLYDSFGSLGLKNADLAALRAAGGRAEAFLPLLWKRRPFTMNLRNHRKLLVVDGETGFVGGRNVGDEYFTDRIGHVRPWIDAMVEVRGPAVDRMQDVFIEDWCTATDEVLADTFVLPAVRGDTKIGIVCSGPDRDESGLWFALIQAIGEAESSVELSSPYLVPRSTLLFALQLAAARGVRVRIHTNGPKTESPVLYFAQRSYYARWLDAGIEIYESVDVYNHAKVLVVDARTVVVGSANMDLRSAHLNFEIAAVVVGDEPLARTVLDAMETRRAGFRRIGEAHVPRRPWSRAIDGLCGLLSPLL